MNYTDLLTKLFDLSDSLKAKLTIQCYQKSGQKYISITLCRWNKKIKRDFPYDDLIDANYDIVKVVINNMSFDLPDNSFYK